MTSLPVHLWSKMFVGLRKLRIVLMYFGIGATRSPVKQNPANSVFLAEFELVGVEYYAVLGESRGNELCATNVLRGPGPKTQCR